MEKVGGLNSIVSLGIVSYPYDCVESEKERMGNEFVWGVGQDLLASSTLLTNGSAAGVASDDSFDFNDDLKEWQKAVAYVTFSLNGLFVLLFAAFFVFKWYSRKMKTIPISDEVDKSQKVETVAVNT